MHDMYQSVSFFGALDTLAHGKWTVMAIGQLTSQSSFASAFRFYQSLYKFQHRWYRSMHGRNSLHFGDCVHDARSIISARFDCTKCITIRSRRVCWDSVRFFSAEGLFYHSRWYFQHGLRALDDWTYAQIQENSSKYAGPYIVQFESYSVRQRVHIVY